MSHPAPGVTTCPSVASLILSINVGATRYRVFHDAQPPRQEMIMSIHEMFEVRDLLSTKTWFNNLVLICANLSNHANLFKLVAFYLNYLQITNKIVANYY